MGVCYVAGSHEVEVSSGVNSRKRSARSLSRLSRKAATSNADEESSSLQTLAAAADSGELNPRPTVSLAVDLWCLLQALLHCGFLWAAPARMLQQVLALYVSMRYGLSRFQVACCAVGNV